MNSAGPALISFWIERTDPGGPIGFGVTAWSPEDAFALIEEAGYEIDGERAVVHPHTMPDVVSPEVWLNAGKVTSRGIWYPTKKRR